MADIAKYGTGQVAGFPEPKSGRIYKASVTLDASAANLNTTDTYLLIPIPSGALVKNVIANVKTANGSAGTLDIGSRVGSTNASTQFFSNLDMNAVGKSISASSAEKLFTADGFITVNCDNAQTLSKLTITAIFIDTNE